MGEAKKKAEILKRLDEAQKSGELAGMVVNMTMANITPDMLALVNLLIQTWEEDGKGKLSPSKALKKLVWAQSQGCPLFCVCKDCPKVRACPILECNNNNNEEV